jgi:hypothetical protein
MYEINRSAEDAYVAIVRLISDIDALVIKPYQIPPDFEHRFKEGKFAPGLLEDARRRRSEDFTPFCDAVTLATMAADGVDDSFIAGLLYHQEPVFEALSIAREEILSKGICAQAAAASMAEPWAIISAVRTQTGEKLHIPMLDFRCVSSDANREIVRSIAQRLCDFDWVVIESGRSYHLVGAHLVKFERLIEFFGRALLLGPLVDRNYVAHQMINGYAALRVKGGNGRAEPRACMATLPMTAWGLQG